MHKTELDIFKPKRDLSCNTHFCLHMNDKNFALSLAFMIRFKATQKMTFTCTCGFGFMMLKSKPPYRSPHIMVTKNTVYLSTYPLCQLIVDLIFSSHHHPLLQPHPISNCHCLNVCRVFPMKCHLRGEVELRMGHSPLCRDQKDLQQ